MMTIAKPGPRASCTSLYADGILGNKVMIHILPFVQSLKPMSYGSVGRALTLV